VSSTREQPSVVRDRISERLTRERVGLEVRRARRPFVFWLLLLAGAVIAFVLLLTKLHVPAPWTSQYQFNVAAANANAVLPGQEVRIAGVPVGRISGVSLRGDVPVISAAIAPQYAPLYRDARVDVRPNTPLQDMYLDIVSRGTRSAGRIPDGGELAAAQTQSPVEIGKVADIFDAAVRPRVRAAIQALGAGLGDHGVQFRQALVELAPFLQAAQRLNRELAVRATETRRLIHNFALMNEELAGRTTQVAALVTDGARTMERLATVEQPLGRLIDELPPMLRVLPQSFAALRAAADQLGPAAVALLPVARALGPALASLQQLSPVANQALAALDRPLPGLTGLLGATTPLANRLSRSFSLLRPQAPQLDHVTAAILPCELAVQKFFQWTLSVSKLSGLHGDMQRGLALIGAESATGLAGFSKLGSVFSQEPSCAGKAAGSL
jgi:virulence factor Mce-like protein